MMQHASKVKQKRRPKTTFAVAFTVHGESLKQLSEKINQNNSIILYKRCKTIVNQKNRQMVSLRNYSKYKKRVKRT